MCHLSSRLFECEIQVGNTKCKKVVRVSGNHSYTTVKIREQQEYETQIRYRGLLFMQTDLLVKDRHVFFRCILGDTIELFTVSHLTQC